MSIEQKIADLLEEANKLEVEQVAEEAVVAEETVDESHQADTTMKHVKNPTAGEKKAAKDMKPGIAGYKDRIDMLKSAEAGGRLKKEEAEYTVDMSEDIAALTNGEELSEEFKTKAATIFEAAVVTRVKSEIARLAEEFDAQLDEQVESIKEGLVEKLDGYLNQVVEQLVQENELALESGMMSEIMESFIDGRNVRRHYWTNFWLT